MSADARRKGSGGLAVGRLLDGATTVFGSYGFAKATVQDIATAAGVSKPIFYRHFENKQAIFERVVEHVLEDWLDALVESIARTSGGAEAELRVFFLDSLEYGRQNTLISRLLTRDAQFLISTQTPVTDRAVEALTNTIREILARGKKSGEIRKDLSLDHMADFLTEMHFAYANRQLVTGVPVAGALAADLVETMLAAVRS